MSSFTLPVLLQWLKDPPNPTNATALHASARPAAHAAAGHGVTTLKTDCMARAIVPPTRIKPAFLATAACAFSSSICSPDPFHRVTCSMTVPTSAAFGQNLKIDGHPGVRKVIAPVRRASPRFRHFQNFSAPNKCVREAGVAHFLKISSARFSGLARPKRRGQRKPLP